MLKSILVPLDGSPATAAATDFAGLIARAHGASLTGLGVVDTPTITAGASAPVGGASFKHERDGALIEDARAKIGSFITTFGKTCTEAAVMHQTQVVEELPYAAINRIGRSHDLIVIGRDTCFHFETSDRPGETLGHLVRDSSAPLCVVTGESAAVETVLIAVDSATPSARTVQLFAHLGLCAEAAINVVSVDADTAVARARCAATADYLRLHGFEATVQPIVSLGKPDRAILDRATSCGAGMIVMGAHGGGKVHEFFFGGTTRRVLQESPVPVFIHH